MIKRFLSYKYIFLLLLLCLMLFSKLYINYRVMVNGCTVATLSRYPDGIQLIDTLRTDFHEMPFSAAIYPCFSTGADTCDLSAAVRDARKKLGIEISYVVNLKTIPFPEETIEDASLLQNKTAIQNDGQNGSMTVITKVTSIDSDTIHEEVISESIFTKPIARVTAVGTKPPTPGVGSGTFSYPLTTIKVSSGFGTRWNRMHGGIDFAAESGTDILASDDGVVSFSGEADGYGNLIIIDHQNGFHTYYAHCSALYVPYGKIIQKGDVIASVGSTGNSTGPHLHFEIRKNGEVQNPANYISL